MFHHLFERVNRLYERIFESYGRFLAKFYIAVIVGAFFLNLILSAGMYRFRMLKDADSLFMPEDSQARLDERLVKSLFNESSKMTSDFFLHQILDLGTWAEVNFQTCDRKANNILSEPFINLISRINEHLLKKAVAETNLSKSDVNSTFRRITFEDVCARRNEKCLIDGSDLLSKTFYDRWLRDAMQRKQRFYEEQSIFNKSDSSIASEFRFYIKFENLKPSITDLSYNLGKSFHVNAINESQDETVFAYAQGLKLRYNLKSDFENADELVKLWELEFLKVFNSLALTADKDDCIEFEGQRILRISYATSQSLDQEMAANIALDTKLIAGTFVLIMIFACILMAINSNCVTSPGVLLPMMGITSAMFGVTSSFGLMAWIGYDGCNLIFVIPFLVIGLGIDDMFIIYATYLSCYQKKINESRHPSKVLQNSKNEKNLNNTHKLESQIISDLITTTLAKSGVSITITSLTDFVAFLVGLTTNFKSVQIFCVYAGFAILFCYLYQITIFCGFLSLHIKRILKNRNSYLFCFNQNSFNKLSICEKFVCCTDLPVLAVDDLRQEQELVELNCKEESITLEEKVKDQENQEKEIAANDSTSSKYRHKTKVLNVCKIQKQFKKFFKFLICTKLGKTIGIVFFILYLSLSIWSASQIKEGINLADLVAENSYYSKYTHDNAKLTDLTPIVMFVIYEPLDYDNVHTRMKLKNLFFDAFKIEGIKKGFSLNWLTSFGNYRINYKANLTNLFSKLKDFPPFLNDIVIRRCELNKIGENKTGKCDIVKYDPTMFDDDDENDLTSQIDQNYNSNFTLIKAKEIERNVQYQYQIIASRFYVQYSRIHFSSTDAKPMHILRKLCSESKLPIIPYSITFKYYEQFEQTLPNVLQSFLIAFEAMYLIALIFIPDLVSVICIILTMSSILVGLIGFMNLWSLTLSSITMIELIMSVGFCVDFSAHICHAFIAKSYGDRNRRAYKACLIVGIPIFNSALSTIIGLSLLAFCHSYIFISFFKTMTILMVLGVLNSLIFLPILLSLIGPQWPRHKHKDVPKIEQTPNSDLINSDKAENI